MHDKCPSQLNKNVIKVIALHELSIHPYTHPFQNIILHTKIQKYLQINILLFVSSY